MNDKQTLARLWCNNLGELAASGVTGIPFRRAMIATLKNTHNPQVYIFYDGDLDKAETDVTQVKVTAIFMGTIPEEDEGLWVKGQISWEHNGAIEWTGGLAPNESLEKNLARLRKEGVKLEDLEAGFEQFMDIVDVGRILLNEQKNS